MRETKLRYVTKFAKKKKKKNVSHKDEEEERGEE
jgi:hypothetical protein